MRIQRLGERAVILRELPCQAYSLALAVNLSNVKGIRGTRILEAVASYDTVGLFFDSADVDLPNLDEWVRLFFEECSSADESERRIELPVCYELGEDLADAAKQLNLPIDDFIRLHLAGDYRCYAVGFSPGFAYLGYLDGRLSLPRLASPRKRVEAGSVGIAGRQTAVYPSATPGGWNLIGKCPLTLVDVADGYFPIEAGDQVRFRRIDSSEFVNLQGERL